MVILLFIPYIIVTIYVVNTKRHYKQLDSDHKILQKELTQTKEQLRQQDYNNIELQSQLSQWQPIEKLINDMNVPDQLGNTVQLKTYNVIKELINS